MRISTSTCSHEKTLWADHIEYSCEDALRALKEAGYRVIDMNFASYSREPEPMTRPDWRAWCIRQKALADALGLAIDQAHAHFYGLNEDGSEAPRDRELIERSIEGAGLMGVKWMVFHPYNVTEDGWFSHPKSLKRNVELFREYADLCRPKGIHIAIENMIGNKARGRRYCSGVDELIELVDALNDPLFGICWDFGHANLNGVNQPAALRKIGKRLKTLHVDDNFGVNDDHLAPYFGNIQWAPIMRALREIGYAGDFTYEIFRFHNGLPDAMQPLTLAYTYKLAEYMLTL